MTYILCVLYILQRTSILKLEICATVVNYSELCVDGSVRDDPGYLSSSKNISTMFCFANSLKCVISRV